MFPVSFSARLPKPPVPPARPVLTADNILQLQAQQGNARAKAIMAAKKERDLAQTLFDRMQARRQKSTASVSSGEFTRLSERLQRAKTRLLEAEKTKS